jgi:hypothetical protein
MDELWCVRVEGEKQRNRKKTKRNETKEKTRSAQHVCRCVCKGVCVLLSVVAGCLCQFLLRDDCLMRLRRVPLPLPSHPPSPACPTRDETSDKDKITRWAGPGAHVSFVALYTSSSPHSSPSCPHAGSNPWPSCPNPPPPARPRQPPSPPPRIATRTGGGGRTRKPPRRSAGLSLSSSFFFTDCCRSILLHMTLLLHLAFFLRACNVPITRTDRHSSPSSKSPPPLPKAPAPQTKWRPRIPGGSGGRVSE